MGPASVVPKKQIQEEKLRDKYWVVLMGPVGHSTQRWLVQ